MRSYFSLIVVVVASTALSAAVAPASDIELKEGDPAPSFTCKDDSGKDWKSKDHYGKKRVVVYFYPAAMTGGCTKQACDFRDQRAALEKLNVEVVGVSGDDVEGLKLFKKVHSLNFPLLADSDGRVAKAFGVPTRSGGEIVREVDGKEHTLSRGVTSARWTFIIDLQGKIESIDRRVNAAKSSEYVIKALSN